MHIPKTSGLALTAGLAERFNGALVHGFDRSLFGAFDQFETMSPDVLDTIRFQGLPAGRAFAGHMSYLTLSRAGAGAQIMTVLREPRSRLLSLWMYWRSRTAAELHGWGAWRDVVALSYRSLLEFLSHPEAVSATDNCTVRMLLWPHPLIPQGRPINEVHDGQLLREAMKKIDQLAFYDLVENPRLSQNLADWFGRPIAYGRTNQTDSMPRERRVQLAEMLTPDTLRQLDRCSRLDRMLWDATVERRIPGAVPSRLADETFQRTINRHNEIMAETISAEDHRVNKGYRTLHLGDRRAS
jgi:hypothetical protein